jgi:predicted RND superfamily exporter protein
MRDQAYRQGADCSVVGAMLSTVAIIGLILLVALAVLVGLALREYEEVRSRRADRDDRQPD